MRNPLAWLTAQAMAWMQRRMAEPPTHVTRYCAPVVVRGEVRCACEYGRAA